MKLLGVNERKGTFQNEKGEEIKWRSYDLVFASDYKTLTVKCNADQIDRSLAGVRIYDLVGQDLDLYQNVFTKRYIIQKVKK